MTNLTRDEDIVVINRGEVMSGEGSEVQRINTG
jgi:hypothetical protein